MLHQSRNHLSKPEDLTLQNATPLRKSPPRSPNTSNSCVSCTAPATRKAFCKCPTPATVFRNATKPPRFAHVGKVQNPLRLPRKTTLVRACSAFNILTWKCASRQQRRSTFSTSQLPKVVRSWCALHILTWVCASRHNSMHFFDISTSKSGPTWVCFVRFDFEMCLAPQQRSLFRHLNFQNWSEHEGCFVIFLTSKCASRHNCVQLFISHLARWLRTRRFSEPTFRPSGATNHWKNTVFRDFPIFSRTCIFFLLTLSLLSLFPPLLFHLSILSEV